MNGEARFRAPAKQADRPRMLAVVANFKWMHIDYLAALAEQFELRVAWSGQAHVGAVERAIAERIPGMIPLGKIADDGLERVSARLESLLSAWTPDVVHLMYYYNEALTLLARQHVGDRALVVHECRDPLTTLFGDREPTKPDSENWRLERDALVASDAQIFVSEALRSYLERIHELDLRPTSLIVPQGFARRTVGRPVTKLSERDGRVHIGLVGTADDLPDHGRWYVEIIRKLVSLGLVVHSHFHDLERVTLEPYRALASELEDYHHHPTLSPRIGTGLSAAMSRYDLMGVFHELGASHHNEAACLAVCLPTKSVCGWLHGGIPVVCYSHYQGVVERIQSLEIGFVVDRLDDIVEVAADRAAIARATERCLAVRDIFTNEHNAERIRVFVEPLLAARAPTRQLTDRAIGP